jgi:hypothetical protein
VSDALCRFVTGEGVSKRELYSDDDDIIYSFLRQLVLTGVNLVIEKPDLLDRTILLRLAEIPKKQRKPEGALWQSFAAARPRLLGALLDALSGALREEPRVQLDELPRMADYARWGVAVQRALGRNPAAFLAALEANTASQNTEALEASAVAQAVLALMRDRAEWSGTATELLGALNGLAEGLKIDVRARAWPKDGGWMGRRLREVAPNLAQAGLLVGTEDRTGQTRLITIRKGAGDGVTAADADTARSASDDTNDSGSDADASDGVTSSTPGDSASDAKDTISGDYQGGGACFECGALLACSSRGVGLCSDCVEEGGAPF